MFQVSNTLYQRANLKRFFKNIKKNSLKILHISIFTNFPKLPPGGALLQVPPTANSTALSDAAVGWMRFSSKVGMKAGTPRKCLQEDSCSQRSRPSSSWDLRVALTLRPGVAPTSKLKPGGLVLVAARTQARRRVMFRTSLLRRSRALVPQRQACV